jgi:hypothetical protein
MHPADLGTPSLDNSPGLFDVTYSIGAVQDAAPNKLIAAKSVGTILSGARPIGVSLGIGIYQIDIQARNGWFLEMFSIENCKGHLEQASAITKRLGGGRLMQTTPHDPDCFKVIPLPPVPN